MTSSLPTAVRLSVATLVVLLAPSLRAADHPLIQAAREEIARAMAGLRLPGQPAPYFIAAAIDDGAGRQIVSTMGASVTDGRNRSRFVRVDVRVGDYTRDSSRFFSFDRDPGVMSMYGMGMMQAPLDENVDVLRRQLWLIIDGAYRRALTTFAKKQAAQQNQAAPDPVPDWSKETPHTTLLPIVPPAIVLDAWVAHARTLSATLARPGLTRSEVTVGGFQGTRYAVTSEGMTTIAPLQHVTVRLMAETQAADGMPLREEVTAHARTVAGLPAVADLTARAKALADGVLALKQAPVGEAYTGPVLVEGQASAALLSQTLVPLFAPQRPPEMENPQMFGPAGRQGPEPFLTRVGSRVLPESFTVSDTPSLQTFEGREVAGAYAVDDEGVPAQDVTLCDKGILKALLTSRTPQKGFLTSNGHGRGGRAQPGVVQIQSSSAVPAAALKAKYLERLKADGRAFGYIVRQVAPVAGPSDDPDEMMAMAMSMAMRGGPSGPAIVRAFKVTADGTETLVRGLQFATVPHAAFKDLVEASQERVLYSYRSSQSGALQMMAMMQGGGSGGEAVVSLIAPDLLFGELEIEKPDRPFQRAPIVAAPQP